MSDAEESQVPEIELIIKGGVQCSYTLKGSADHQQVVFNGPFIVNTELQINKQIILLWLYIGTLLRRIKFKSMINDHLMIVLASAFSKYGFWVSI